MAHDTNGNWLGYGVGDSDNESLPRTARNWHAVSLINEKLTRKYQWARDLGVTEGPMFTVTTAAAIDEFCSRTGLPEVYDADGHTVANLAVRKRLGSYPAPAPVLPLFFTVEGHGSDMWRGPVADTAEELQSEELCHHFPTYYDCNAVPFNNQSGVDELARRYSTTEFHLNDGTVIPFPAGTPSMLGGYSQGDIVVFDFYCQYLAPGKPLEWRTPDILGVIEYGPPTRPTDAVAPWCADQNVPGSHGLDPYRRFDMPGYPSRPDNWVWVFRRGDIFADIGSASIDDAIQAAVYEAVARADVLSDPYGLARQIAQVFSVGAPKVLAVILAMIRGVQFAADNPNPHYSPFELAPGIEWCRGLLKAALR